MIYFFFQNKTSSRSHAVLQVFFEKRWIEVKKEGESESSKEIKKVTVRYFLFIEFSDRNFTKKDY